MNNLQIFQNNDFGEIRTVIKDNEPWFIAKDICIALNLSNTTVALSRLDDDEVTKLNLGGMVGETNLINKYGLYSLILSSRKKEAKQFKRWITHEVLPSIEKHGAYMTPQKIEEVLLSPDTLIQLATNLKEEQQKRKIAENQLELQKPKVLFADAVETSKSSILVGELSKIIKQNDVNIGQNKLFKWLRDNNYLCKKGEKYNLPTDRAMTMGLFEIKKTTINNPDGSIRTTRTTKVTGKGQQYFINKFL
jgi:prophage antirepressor-like protein